ncbi:MAG: hypothetical protein CMP49_03140 [Flavobacteriales bacterium]|nr:hypothetical protein [Flavobacteriales bacterium]|tara:strand:+ start:2750 stop:5122 length:2373 start_codon:yes stop_codon:yes gene_type:complete
MRKYILVITLISYWLTSQNIIVKPYLQNASSNSIVIMWEFDQIEDGHVEWGISEDLNNTTIAEFENSSGFNYIFTATINNLSPNTKYYYRTVNYNTYSDVYSFYTEDLSTNESSTKMIIMSDMQTDSSFPNKFHEIVHEGILNYVQQTYTGQLNDNINLVLIPGDLVYNGLNYNEWQDNFFHQGDSLFSFVPLYPVPGNHENNSPYFFQYFNLPLNGTNGFEEHWWYKDISNIRIIGLDSNTPYRIEEQLIWLENILLNTANNTNIDFVFAQLHHPHKSELWTPGNTDYTGEIISLLENFSTESGKPSVHFFGHTHGYSRGQSKDHTHLMVNVASAGGAIDYWGEFPNNDYEEYTISQDEYGYVLVETTAGDNPQFILKRISLGDQELFKNNYIEDSITIKINNLPPTTPINIFPYGNNINPNCVTLSASIFNDPDLDEHGATQWQISNNCNDFSNPIFDVWKQSDNWYNEINTQENDDLTDQEIESLNLLDENTNYCWRVRYRDKGLKWSEWSNPLIFETGTSNLSNNLLNNDGAEDNINFWDIESGILESLSALECNGINPFNGEKYFSVGGLCDESPFGYVSQTIDLYNYYEEINKGQLTAFFGAHLANWGGDDIPSIGIQCLDENNNILFATEMYTSSLSSWNLVQNSCNIPFDTKKIKYIMTGERISGTDNDSYIDDAFLLVGSLYEDCSIYTESISSIQTFIEQKITINPNQLKNESVLNIPYSNYHSVNIQIYDSFGQLVENHKHIHPPSFIIKKNNMSSGNYYIRVTSEEKIIGNVRFQIIN